MLTSTSRRPATCFRVAEGAIYRTAEARVLLIPPYAWWTALYCAEPAECELYCGITTPSTWTSPTEVTQCRRREHAPTGPRIVTADSDDPFGVALLYCRRPRGHDPLTGRARVRGRGGPGA